uniref:Ig-like domain-containing protein n=1 Tax=Oryzias melastigma TaxID=30732 RepID=A0A3B3DIE9_ORYME
WTLFMFFACSQALEFSSSLHFKSLAVGQDVTLKCFSKHSQTAIFYWYKQTLGQRPRLLSEFHKHRSEGSLKNDFENDQRFQLEIGDGKNHLKISNAQTSDSGTYYCVGVYSYIYEFYEGYSVLVEDSSSYIQTSVDQSSSENIHPGDSVTLNCTVHTGSCDGEHRVYWFKDSEDSHPGLIYTHGGRNDQCERKKNTQTNSCVYNLHMKNLTESHSGIYYCAAVSCGHILFGNGTKLDLTEGIFPPFVYFLGGALTASLIFLIFYTIHKTKSYLSDHQDPVFYQFLESELNTEKLHSASMLHRSGTNFQKTLDQLKNSVYLNPG